MWYSLNAARPDEVLYVRPDMRLEPVTATVVHLCANTGRALRTKQHNNTRITFAIDEANKKCLVIGVSEKLQQDFYVDGGVRIHAKFASQGKATLTLVRRNIQIMISNADADSLIGWCRSLMSGHPPPPKAEALRAVEAPVKRPMAPSSSASINSPMPMSRSQQPNGLAAAPSRKMERPPTVGSASSPAGNLSPNTARQLTSEQQDVLREVVLGGRSVFFTGGAGTGKSFLLKQIVARLDPRTTFVTASTGIAACAVGGTTIHHFAGIGGFSQNDKTVEELVRMAQSRRGAQWRACKVLIIDEISMLDGPLFDLLETIARRVRNCSRPFGGIQLVVVGDFFQLPPVSKAGGTPCKFAFEATSWGMCVQRTFELTVAFRQSDPEFVTALNNLRVGIAPPATKLLLGSRVGKVLPQSDGIVATRLFTHKADCQKLNEEQLKSLGGQQCTFSARDTSRDDAALALLRQSCPAQPELTLKVGAQVILIKTLDAEAGLANGARGVVTKFLSTRNPSVRFDNGVEQTMRMEAFGLAVGGQTVACRMQVSSSKSLLPLPPGSLFISPLYAGAAFRLIPPLDFETSSRNSPPFASLTFRSCHLPLAGASRCTSHRA